MQLKQLCGAAAAAWLLLASGAGALASQPGLPNFADVYERVSPGVVAVRVMAKPGQADEAQTWLLDRFGSTQLPNRRGPRSRTERELGNSTGFLLSPDGYLLTVASVLEDADTVRVTLPDGRSFKARVVGVDRRSELGLLKIDGTGLPYLRTGDSGKIRTGEWVLAIGGPNKLASSISAGIISYKSRETGEYLPAIQTDVMINPGSGGGPLLNLDGEVIGVNTTILTSSGSFSGISFSVPINEVLRIVQELKAHGKVVRGRIGLTTEEPADEDGTATSTAAGAAVKTVEQGGPADKAGVMVGDIILMFNGQPVPDNPILARLVGASAPGSRARLTILRKGVRQELNVTVGDADEVAAARSGKVGERKK